MGGNRALLLSTLLAACIFQMKTESCNITECPSNRTVNVTFVEHGGAWNDEDEVCRNNATIGYPYRAVVANVDEMYSLRCEIICNNLPRIWIDFARNISKPLYSMNTSFLEIPLNLTSSNPSGKCFVLHFNGSDGNFTWGLDNCTSQAQARFCMEERRSYWNASGTNNVLPGPLDDDPIEYEKVIQDCARGLIVDFDCDQFNDRYDSVIKVMTLEGSNCDRQTARFDHYSAECGNYTIVAAEMLSNITQIRDYIPENFRVMGETQTRKTVLPPPGNKLFSISVIIAKGATVSSTNISFKCRLDYRRLFKESSYDLSYDSDDGGLLRTTYRYFNHEPIGVFLDSNNKKFDTAGVACSGKGELITCTSNHTTVFAVLLSVETVKIPEALKVCAVVTQSISVFFLFLTFAILLKVRKKVRGERIPIQINLSLSLLLLHFWLLWGDIAIHYPAFCRAIAVLTYFFLLSSALWMMNEAHLLFFRTSKWAALATKRRKIVIATICTGWVVPVIITAITTAVGFSRNTFMEVSEFVGSDGLESGVDIREGPLYEHCILSAKNEMRLAAIIPVAVILTYNFVVAIWAVVFVHRKRLESIKYKPSSSSESELHHRHFGDILHSLKVIFLLLPILGLPWILTLLSNWGTETVKLGFMYATTLINGLQGVLIFLIYCVADTKVREALKGSLASLSSAWTSISDSREKRRKSSANNSGSGVIPAASNCNNKQNEGVTVKTDLQ